MSRFQGFLNIWAIVGPIVGILLGSWLTTRNQTRIEFSEIVTRNKILTARGLSSVCSMLCKPR
jgi:hypothetical protein